MTVTKDKIIAKVSEGTRLSKSDARQVVESLLGLIKRTLAGGEDLLISGFGKFAVKRKRTRRGRNPQTGEELELRPRRVVVFHNSERLRTKIEGRIAPAPDKT